MKNFFRLLLFISFSSVAFSQQDTLTSKQKKKYWGIWNSTSSSAIKRLNAIDKLAWDYVHPQPDSALVLAQLELKLAREKSEKEYTSKAFFTIGLAHHNNGATAQSLTYFSKALPYYRQLKVCKEKAYFYFHLGTVYFRNSDFPKSLDAFFKSLAIREKLKDKEGMGYCYNNIGLVYSNQKRYSQALKYYFKTLAISKETNNEKWIAISSFNINDIYQIQHNYSKALYYLKQSLVIWKKLENKRFIAGCYTSLGDIYCKQHNYELGLDYYSKAGVLLREVTDKIEMVGWYMTMADVNTQLGNYELTILYCDSALQLNKDNLILDYEAITYNFLANAYTKMGNYKKAYEAQLKSQAITDSVFTMKNSQNLSDVRIQYEVEKKADELKNKAKQQLIEQRLERNTYLGIAGLLLLTTLFLFNRSRLKQKNRHQQQLNYEQKKQAEVVFETQERERKRIAQDLHDSLGQLLSTTKLNLQQLPTSSDVLIENSLDLLDQASVELRNIAFNLMPYTLAELGLVAALGELSRKIKQTSSVEITLFAKGIERDTLDPQMAINLYRILQEAINNSLKHAEASEISIQLLQRDNYLSIMVEDDGKGFDASKIKKTGMGLGTMVARSKWLNGEIAIDSAVGRGTTITIEIPLLP